MPEGPAAVSLGKDRKIAIMLKSGSNETGVVWTTGGTGVGQLGCLDFNSCRVVSLLGAIPLDCRMRQAFPHIPDLPSDTAWSITLVRWLIDVRTSTPFMVCHMISGQIPEVSQLIIQPHVAQNIDWKGLVMASLTSEGWKDTLWEHKELKPRLLRVL